jgi:curved DNA-binding protein
MARKDYYEVLGVGRTASDKEIKAAYRRLARKHHPDVNKGDPKAEERFKDVAEAFAVLSDKEKRARYDAIGSEAFGSGHDPFAGSDFRDFEVGGFGDISSLLEQLFGLGHATGTRRGAGGRARAAREPVGRDLRMELRVPFAQAVAGGTVEIGVPRGGRTAERLKVRIPAGTDDGATLRLAGQGEAGAGGAGDAYLVIRVEPHPLFRREGRDLFVDVPLGIARAALGGTVEVPTLEGRATITIPEGTRSGQRFRLKGRGVPAGGGREAGDLFAVVQLEPPKALTPRSRELLEELARIHP